MLRDRPTLHGPPDAPRPRRLVALALLAFACGSRTGLGEDVPARKLVVSVDQETFDAEFGEQLEAKFRLVDVGIVVADRKYVFAGLFEDRLQPRFRFEVGFTTDAFRKRVAELAEDGFHVSRFGSVFGGETLFYAIWEEEPRPESAWRFDLDAAALSKEHDRLAEEGFRLRCLATSTGEAGPRFHGLWEKCEERSQKLEVDSTQTGVRRSLNREPRRGYRVRQIVGYVDSDDVERYAVVWERATGPRQLVTLRLTDDDVADAERRMRDRGYVPQSFHAYAVRELDRYAIVWVYAGK